MKRNNPFGSRLATVLLTIFKIVPFAVILICCILYARSGGEIKVEQILAYTPDNALLAALALIGLYAVKSLSVVFPLLVLYISAGVLFSAPIAILVNTAGLLVCLSVPYWIGRFSGKELVEKLERRHPMIARMNAVKQGSEFFFSFFLRVINMLPGDIVSMVLGASKMRYSAYMAGSMLGLLPTMLSATFLGEAILTPMSPVFLISACTTILISVVSFLVWRHTRKRMDGEENKKGRN